MYMVVTKNVLNATVQKKAVLRVRIADYRIPSGITADVLTEAGSMIVASAVGVPAETGAPSADGQVWVSDLSLPKKGYWGAVASGGGVAKLTNKSGSTQAAGTVVIMDADNNESFTTTSIRGDRRVIGVLAEDIANNSAGNVYVGATTGTVKVTGAVSRGMWLIASATTEYAEANGYTRPNGAVGLALTENASGTGTITALIIIDLYLGASRGKGYFAGGNVSTYTNSAYLLSYITEITAAQSSANLSVARYGLAGISDSSAKGYFAGGYSGAVTDKTTFASDTTAAQSSANLSLDRYWLSGINGNGLKGYFAGGNTGAYSAVTDKTTFASDTTAAQSSANLSVARYWLSGTSGALAGYFAGGYTGVNSSVVDKCVYSTDTTSVLGSAALPTATRELAGISSLV